MVELKDIGKTILAQAKKAGADKVEVFVQRAKNTFLSLSEQKLEQSTRSLTQGFGLRFIKGDRQIFVSSSDISDNSIADTVDKASQLVRFVDEDPWCTVAKAGNAYPSVEIVDSSLEKLPLESRIEYIRKIEREAMTVDKRIIKASGISYAETLEQRLILTTNGIQHHWEESHIELGATMLAVDGDDRQEGETGLETHFYSHLPTAESIGQEAAKRALLQLGAKTIGSTSVPIVFDPMAGYSILRYGVFEGARADDIARKASFLTDKLNTKIASELVTIVDDGLLPQGVGTAPCDGEGVPSQKTVIVDKGVLSSYLYDSYWAHRLNASSTSSAVRGSYKDNAHIRPRNLYLAKGHLTPEQIIADVRNGFWVMKTIGFGVDSVSGTYSIGATGRWIRNGKLQETIGGVTIAASLTDILNGIDAVGNDLIFRYNVATPTFRVANMAVSGTAAT